MKNLLDDLSEEAVFQVEKGKVKNRIHYQGRFTLKGKRQGKKFLLNKFSEIGSVSHLTFQPEVSVKNSVDYCTKVETRVAGPFYCGVESYKIRHQRHVMALKRWQLQFLWLLLAGMRNYSKNVRLFGFRIILVEVVNHISSELFYLSSSS